ncbi:MAG TPA: zf-HC2 domain-containing protein, partial [Candidatus Limnocylindrales bacterium]|nr:zf-HC2 domain-containing protein [Candidatus Limnocylindrales bacterium]
MNIHEGFLDLASAAIDFELDEYERAELDRHLAGCDDCRRTTAAFRDDAVAIASGPRPRLPADRSVAILDHTLRPPKASPGTGRLAVVAV